jgi:hypothetical protein
VSSAGVRVGVGTRFRYDGETVEVIEMAITATGNEVVLKDHHGLLQNGGVSGCGVCPGLTGSVDGEEVPSG